MAALGFDRVVLLPPRESTTAAIQSGKTVAMRSQLSGNEFREANARSGECRLGPLVAPEFQ